MNEYLVSGKQGNYQILTENKDYGLSAKTKSQLFGSMLEEKFFLFKGTRKTIGAAKKLQENEESFMVYTAPDHMRLSWLNSFLFHLVGALLIWFALDFFLNYRFIYFDGKTFAEVYSAFFLQSSTGANITPSFVLAISFWAVPSALLCTLPSFGFFHLAKLYFGWLPHYMIDQTLGRISDQLSS